ncbi:hypothetical protein SI35_06320 [Salmonella enterica]|nr:hypothetical protein [Salmonella enterica]EGG4133910.1 hypothetical protein [Salmonella enterica]
MFYNDTKTRQLYCNAVNETFHTDNVVIFFKEGYDRIAIAEGGRIALRERTIKGRVQWIFDNAASAHWCQCWADLQGVDGQLLNTIDNGKFIIRARYALQQIELFASGYLCGLSVFYGSGRGGDRSYDPAWCQAFQCGLKNMPPEEIYEENYVRQ